MAEQAQKWRDQNRAVFASRKWDLGVMLSLATAALACMAYILEIEITEHNRNDHAHPGISADIEANTKQLDRIELRQLREVILRFDALLCDDKDNRAYRRELADLLDEFFALSGRRFPPELLQCTRGRQ